MRNLKRALSLALALVMVLSMMVVGASAVSADDFSDSADIVNKEAVTVLATLGVITGNDDGSYAPADTISRAEMSTIICRVLNGGKNPVLGEAVSNSYTDTTSHWAKNYIEYCTTLGIVAGKGDGTFDPEGDVTVAEAAKMVLVALGYNADVEGYVGGNWQINTDARANPLGLYDGLDYVNTSAALTRDNAAQMLYNALDCKMVMYDYIITGNVQDAITTKPQLNDRDLGTLLWERFTAVKVEGVVVANEYAELDARNTDTDRAPSGTIVGSHLDEGKTTVLVTNYDTGTEQRIFENKEYTFNATTGEAELGKGVYLYVIPNTTTSDNANRATVVGSVNISEDNTIVTDASGDALTDVADDNGLDLVSGETQYVYNYGGLTTLEQDNRDNWNLPAYDGKTGVQRTLVDTDADGDVNYVLYKEQGLGKVTVYTESNDGYIVVGVDNRNGGSNYINNNKDNVVGFDDVVRDDYVLTAYIGGRLYVQVAETVTGTIEAYKQTDDDTYENGYRNTGFTVDGTEYTVSRVFTYANDIFPAVDGVDKNIISSEATFYLDVEGNVIAYGEVDESAYKYAYIWGAEAGTTNLSTDRVKATLEDGTTKTYDLADNSVVDVVVNGGNGFDKVDEDQMQGRVYPYTITSGGELRLRLPTGGAVTSDGDHPVFTNGMTNIRFGSGDPIVYSNGAVFDGLTAANLRDDPDRDDDNVELYNAYYSNNATTFFYVTYETDENGIVYDGVNPVIDHVSVYNGRNAAPTLDGESGEAILAFNTRGDVAAAAFNGVEVAESAGDHVFIFDVNYVYDEFVRADAVFNGATEATENIQASLVEDDEVVHNPTVDPGIYLYRQTSEGYYELTDPGHDYRGDLVRAIGDGIHKSYYFEGEVDRTITGTDNFVMYVERDGKDLYEEFVMTDDSIVVDFDASDSNPPIYQGYNVAPGDVIQVIVNNDEDMEVLMVAIMDRVDADNLPDDQIYEDSETNGDITLNVYSSTVEDLAADSVLIDRAGDIIANFYVGDENANKDVTFSYTIYVNGVRVARDRDTIPADRYGDVVFTETARTYDEGDDVVVDITNITVQEPEDPVETWTLTLKGELADSPTQPVTVWQTVNGVETKVSDFTVHETSSDLSVDYKVTRGAAVVINLDSTADITKNATYVVDGVDVVATDGTTDKLSFTLNNDLTLNLSAPDTFTQGDDTPAGNVHTVTTHNGVTASWKLDDQEGTIAADSSANVPDGATLTITSVGEGSKVIRTNTAGVGNASYQFDVDDTMLANGDLNLYSASQIHTNGTMTAKIGNTGINDGDYVAVGVNLALAGSGDGFGVHVSTDNSSFGEAVTSYEVTGDDAYLSNGYLVTLGDGVVVKDGTTTKFESGTVLAVNGSSSIAGLTAENASMTVVEAPVENRPYVVTSTTYGGSTTISGTLELVAATKVTVNDTTNTQVRYVTDRGSENTIDNLSSGDLYVLRGKTIIATGLNGYHLTISGWTGEPDNGDYVIEVGTTPITITASNS